MLGSLREGAKSGILKIFLMGFLVMAVGGLVLMDVQGFFRGGVTSTSVAQIDGEKLGAVEFDRTVRRVLSRQSLNPEQAFQFGFIDQILESEITNKVLQKAAWNMGIYVSDKQIAEQIHDLVTPLVNENMDRKEVLRRITMSQGMSEQEFVDGIRIETTNTLLRDAIREGTALTPPQESKDLFLFENEERSFKTVLLPNSAITDIEPAEESVLQALYDAGKEKYAIPELRTFSMLVLSDKLLKDTTVISDEELQQAYDDNIEAFKLPEQRVIEQAVLSSQKEASDVVTKIEKGASMKNAITEVTGDTDGYMGENDFEKEGLLEEIADKVFVSEAGTTVGPVESALGWHVLTIKEILPPSTQSFAKVKETIRKDLLQNRLMDDMFALANTIDDRLAGGDLLEDIAKELKIELKTIGPVRYDGTTPDEKTALPDYPEDNIYVVQTAFEMIEGETAPVMELSTGEFTVIRTDTVQPKDYAPYEALKPQLEAIWMQDKREVINKQRAQDILRNLQKGDTTLADVAKENKVELKTLKGIKRSAPAPEALNSTAKTKLFDISLNDYAISQTKDGVLIGQVTSIDLPDLSKVTEEELNKTASTATQGTKDEFLLMYLQYLRTQHKISVNRNLLAQMYGPGNEQY